MLDLLMTLPSAIIVLLLGGAIGSFLNVVIYRLPAGLSLLFPPSRCPHCLTRLKARENVPVLGWLWLKGRCRHCRTPISPRYPIVEAATAILFLAVFLVFGVSVQTLGYWALVSWLLALSLIDLDTMTLPNPLTQSGLVVGLGFQAIGGFVGTGTLTGAIQGLMTGIVGAVVGIWLLHLITIVGSVVFQKEAMGAGDAKLAALMGAWLGWQNLLVAGFLACLAGAVVGGGAIAAGWLDRRQPVPFGPFLALGTVLALFFGNALVSHYLSLFFPVG
jgi:leader peptidase (prepilin peptidase) / N-methyltransferase